MMVSIMMMLALFLHSNHSRTHVQTRKWIDRFCVSMRLCSFSQVHTKLFHFHGNIFIVIISCCFIAFTDEFYINIFSLSLLGLNLYFISILVYIDFLPNQREFLPICQKGNSFLHSENTLHICYIYYCFTKQA